jgi:hypothetical protein
MQRHAAFCRALEDFLRANGQLPEGEKQLYQSLRVESSRQRVGEEGQ